MSPPSPLPSRWSATRGRCGDVAQLGGVGLRVDQERGRAVPEEPDGHRLGVPSSLVVTSQATFSSRSRRCARWPNGVSVSIVNGMASSLGVVARRADARASFSDRRAVERAADRAGSLDPREVAGAVEHLDRRRGPDGLGGVGRRRDRHRAARAVHEQRGHRDAREPRREARAARRAATRTSRRRPRPRTPCRGRAAPPAGRRSTPARAAASTPPDRPRCPRPPSPGAPAAPPARTSCGGVRRISSASNAASPPSPTPPSVSTTSAAATRSGCAASRCRSRWPPHE